MDALKNVLTEDCVGSCCDGGAAEPNTMLGEPGSVCGDAVVAASAGALLCCSGPEDGAAPVGGCEGRLSVASVVVS